MPSFCSVVGCGSRAERDKLSFFRFPALIKNRGGIFEKLSSNRREKWINALNRGPLSDTMLKNGRICSKHFISGKPAELYNENDPDWIPSQNLGYEFGQQIKKTKASARQRNRKRFESTPQETITCCKTIIKLGTPLRICSVVGHTDTSGTQPQEIEAVYIKEEPVEETWPECHPHINSASLNPALRVDRTSPHVQLRALHTDISIKEEQLEQTTQDRLLYNNIVNYDKDNDREHNTETPKK